MGSDILNPIIKKKELSIRMNLFLEIVFQIIFIIIYMYKLTKTNGSLKLIVAYLTFILILVLYLIYCIYSFKINKYPNHYLWITLKIFIYILKFTVIYIDIMDAIDKNMSFIEEVKTNISLVIAVFLVATQIIFDFLKISKYNFSSDYHNEENIIGLIIVYCIVNPIMSAFYLYSVFELYEYVNWLWILNLILAIVFLLNIFMIFSKYTFNNLLVILALLLAGTDTSYIIYMEIAGESIIDFNGIGKGIEIIIYLAITVGLGIITFSNIKRRKRLIYNKGECPNKNNEMGSLN